MTETMNPSDALLLINTITTCTCANPTDECRHDLRARDLRDLLIDRTDIDLESDAAELLRDLLTILIDSPYHIDALSQLCLDNSLCPMHQLDYAICFDDDDAECAAIRACFPSHDT